MEIKVKNTKEHTYPSKKTYQIGAPLTCSVAEAKLVLLRPTDSDYMGKSPLKGFICIPGEQNYYFKPILISETEKIEEGDWAYNEISKTIFQVREIDNSTGRTYLINTGILSPEENSKKVLALPEHFSPEQLNMIVEGKLKDGDKIYVECITVERDQENWYWPTESVNLIKSPLSIYIIEEKKLYTGEEVKVMIRKFCEWKTINHEPFSHPPYLTDRLKQWFEQNVK